MEILLFVLDMNDRHRWRCIVWFKTQLLAEGQIIPLYRLRKLIVVCVIQGCIMNKQHNMLSLSH